MEAFKRTVINNGYVIDPANKIASQLNIAIEDGKIVEISNKKLQGHREIDAKGLIVTPGFVDCHIHEDPYNEGEDRFEINIFNSLLRMGVTTAIGGNCGIGPKNIPSYIDAINRLGIPINLALLLPHGYLRKLENVNNKYERASPKQIANMKKRAEELLDMGLLGISFGIRYIPGIDEEELLEISSACKKDNKIVAAHIRDDADNVMKAAEEFIYVGKKLGIPLQISHIGSMAAYGQMEDFLSLMDYHSLQGVDLSMDCYPYNAFGTKIGETTYDDGFLERYKTSYASIEIAEGKYRGQRCTEKIFKELRQGAPDTLTIAHVMKEDEVDKALAHPNVFIASDGILNNNQGHPRAAGTFPKVINEYVKRKKIISLYEAVEKMVYLPAKRYGINKGTLSLGSDADISIFDFNTIKDNASFEKPVLPPDGIKYVIINGEIALENNLIKNPYLGRFVTKDK